MKRSIIAAAALLIPAALFADVQITFNAGFSNNVPYETDFNNQDDSWFEEAESHGPARMSLEYQWTHHHGRYLLLCRKVSYFPISSTWKFGPWTIQDGYCHEGCQIHHEHHFYHRPESATQFRREFIREGHHFRPQYHFEPRHEQVEHRPNVDVRHEESDNRHDNEVRHEQSDNRHENEVRRERVEPKERVEVRTYEYTPPAHHEQREGNRENATEQTDTTHLNKKHDQGDDHPVIRVIERERVR